MSFAALTFTYPIVLWALLALPVLWWLLRLIPPSPKRQVFPALELLRDVAPQAQTPAHTPWWLLLLRLAALALIIVGLARPVWVPPATLSGTGAMAVVIDNGWAAAEAWPSWQGWLEKLCSEAEREKRDLLILPTAPARRHGELEAIGPQPALAACQHLRELAPQPWPADHKAALAILKEKLPADAHGFWLNDGLRHEGSQELHDFLSHGALDIYRDPRQIFLLRPMREPAAKDLTATVERLATGKEDNVAVEVRDMAGQVLTVGNALFKEKDKTAAAALPMPADLRNRAAKLTLAGKRGAGAVLLLDGRFRRAAVGLIGDEVSKKGQPLLSGLHYLEQALEGHHDVLIGSAEDLLDKNHSVIVNAGDRALLADERARLAAWVERGGVLIQFAGPELRQDDETLLPVPLREAARNLGGALSWETPQPLQDFPAKSPFAGLAVPSDIAVSRQLLADPSGLGPDQAWALLKDGTPLVTGATRGRGTVVLFHVPASPDWSNLPLSGLLVPMLERLIELAVTGTVAAGNAPLMPFQVMDGMGMLAAPPPSLGALSVEQQQNFTPAPEHPPGIYGPRAGLRAFNLGAMSAAFEPLALPSARELPAGYGNIEARPWLLALAMLLLLADMGLALRLRGLMMMPRFAALALMLAMLVMPHAAQAADSANGVAMTAKTWLGAVENGAGGRAETARAGLLALAQRLKMKTTLEQIDAKRVNLETDDLSFFPLLYWPLAQDPGLSAAAQRKLQDYFALGGMLVIDLPGEAEDNAALKASGIELPMLAPVAAGHPLLRSFYLLDDCHGRTPVGTFWSESDVSGRQDGVPAVFVGSYDWATAWAEGARDARTNELAFRCGVNMVVYALTGNYKSDQIHVSAILERLRR
ncbi:MAG: DUF4159 domain-containing protein [Alphaproteobacteria bacterium]